MSELQEPNADAAPSSLQAPPETAAAGTAMEYAAETRPLLSGQAIVAVVRRRAQIERIITVTLAIGISFALLSRLPWVRAILAVVWLGHIIYFLFFVKLAEETRPD